MSSFSRRRFLEDSLFAATAAVTAGSATHLVAAEGDAKQSSSANEKLTVAVVGAKGRGSSHIGALAGRKDTEIIYICDADEAVGGPKAAGLAERQGRGCKFVADMRRVFDDKSVDIVTIATPNHWHALAAIWAIQAGKDVYVEKPVSHNVSEGRRIVEAARKHGRICQTGTQCRSNPGTIDAIQFVRDGKIGEVKLARGLCYKGRGSIGERGTYEPPASLNFDLWSGPARLLPITRKQFHYDWHWQWEYGNGDLGNQGIHQMDVARWGLGAEGLGTSVVSYGGRFGYTDAGETANTQVSIHQYGDKRLVFEVRGLSTGDLKGARVGNIFYGSKGYVVLTSYNAGAAFDLDGKMIAKFSGGNDALHYENFLKAVRSRKHADLNADIEQGHLSSALCHLGNISYRLGSQLPLAEVKGRLGDDAEAQETLARVSEHLAANKVDGSVPVTYGLKLDLAGEQFKGNEQANQMLTREYRAPFVVPAAGKV